MTVYMCMQFDVYAVFVQGEEVMNTYGQLSNTSLLHMYGFAELGNPHDKVHTVCWLDMIRCILYVGWMVLRQMYS